MVTLSSSTGAVGALATYFTQLNAGTSAASSGGASDEAKALVTLVQGTDTSSGNLATLLGTATTTSSTDSLGTLLGTSVSSTDGLLTQVSSLATALASGTSTPTGNSSDSSSPDASTETSPATQAQITTLLTSAYANEQQGILSLLI